MSKPISIGSPPRLLKPVAGKIQNDGAPFVHLSPHKTVRNASIIYDAIKSLPDQTLIRGDYDKWGQPLIYFPERPPKQVGKVPVDAIAAKNARCDRAEFSSFVRSIIDTAFRAAPAHSPELHAAFVLRKRHLEVLDHGRDFTVGDIREPLRSIASSLRRKELKNVTSPHRTPPRDVSALQIKRFKEFGSMDDKMQNQLGTALAGRLGKEKKAHAGAIAFQAIDEMKKMIFKYRILQSAEGMTFADFLLKHPIQKGAHLFASLWLALKTPAGDYRSQFCTESWALEMDRICPLIVNEYQAARLQSRRDASSIAPKHGNDMLTAPTANERSASTSEPPETPPPARTPRMLKRRFSRQDSAVSVMHRNEANTLSPTFRRQASVPQLRLGSEPGSGRPMSRSHSLSFIRGQAAFQPTLVYSASSAPSDTSGPFNPGVTSNPNLTSTPAPTRPSLPPQEQ